MLLSVLFGILETSWGIVFMIKLIFEKSPKSNFLLYYVLCQNFLLTTEGPF